MARAKKAPAKVAARTRRSTGGRRGRTVDADAAERAAQAAKAKGATGRQDRSGPGAAMRVILRNQAIVAGHHIGRSNAELAREWKVTAGTVQRIVKHASKRRSVLDDAPMEIVERALGEYEAQIEAWSALASAAADSGNLPAAVGAMRGHADAFERYVSTLAELGKLPDNLELFRAQEELERIMRRIAELLEKLVQGELVPAEVQAEFDRLLSPGTALFDAESTAVELPPGK